MKSTTIDEIALAAAGGADAEVLHEQVFVELPRTIAAAVQAGDSNAIRKLVEREPREVDHPWDSALAASVEHTAARLGFAAPQWCNEAGRLYHSARIGAPDAVSWAETLHGAAGAFVRHSTFPLTGTTERALGNNYTEGRGSGREQTRRFVRTARRIETLLEAEGLRGHVYVTTQETVYFTTTVERPRRNAGTGPLLGAVGKAIKNPGRSRDWLKGLATALRSESESHWLPPCVWWDTEHLLITGTSTTTALVALLETDDDDDDEIEQLLWRPETHSVGGADRALRRMTGRPASAKVRRRIAPATAETLAPGRDNWTDRWIEHAHKHLHEGGDARQLVVHEAPEPDDWPYRNTMTCGDFEAVLDGVNAPAEDKGRLWIRKSSSGSESELVLLDANDSNIEITIPEGRDVATRIAAAVDRQRRATAPPDGPWRIEERPGWRNIVSLARYMTAESVPKHQQRVMAEPMVEEGRLVLRADDPDPEIRGLLQSAMQLAAETCEQCGGKGDPIVDEQCRTCGCRCRACRGRQATVLARSWPIRPPRPQVERQGRRADKRLEEQDDDSVDRLMRAHKDDGRAMWAWTCINGWAGLIRALFVTLGPEQDERPGQAGHRPFRIGTMKEKWGTLVVEGHVGSAYQHGAVRFIEMASRNTCVECGRPAPMRYASGVRPQCDQCWERVDQNDRLEHNRKMASRGADEQERGHLGTTIGPGGYVSPFGAAFTFRGL